MFEKAHEYNFLNPIVQSIFVEALTHSLKNGEIMMMEVFLGVCGCKEK